MGKQGEKLRHCLLVKHNNQEKIHYARKWYGTHHGKPSSGGALHVSMSCEVTSSKQESITEMKKTATSLGTGKFL